MHIYWFTGVYTEWGDFYAYKNICLQSLTPGEYVQTAAAENQGLCVKALIQESLDLCQTDLASTYKQWI